MDKLIRRLLWDLRLYAGGDALRCYSELQEWQYCEEGKLIQHQLASLRNLLRHAYAHVPFYTNRLEQSDVISDEGINLDRFQTLPLLDKEALRTQSDSLKSDDLEKRNWWYNTSGGSTGEPVQFIQDQEYQQWITAIKKHFNAWTGYQRGQPRVKLWGSERDLSVGEETMKTRISRWVRNEHCLNAFRMGKDQMRKFVKKINHVEPVQILAYVESIYELAQFIEEKRLEVHSPKAVMTSAGTLYDHMRETIRRVFDAPVFNRYGSREVGDIACECEAHEGLHVSAPTHYVEVLRTDGTPAEPGEVGEIVVTLLTNYAMPLIRYRIGDMGAWAPSSCSCGRSWPLLAEVTGRVSDTFVTEDGRRVHGEFFTHLFYGEEWVEKFQVVQESERLITISVVPSNRSLNPGDSCRDQMDEIRGDIHEAMGEECKVQFEFREEIPPSESGKYRYTISKVEHERA